MLIILSVQVFSRFFGVSNSWSEELARYLFIWLIFVGAGMAAEKTAHITIETMTFIWPKKIRRYVEILGALVWLVFSLVIVYYSANYAIMLYHANRISLSLYVNMAIPYAAIPVGYAFIAVRIVQRELIPRILNKTKEMTLEEKVLSGSDVEVD